MEKSASAVMSIVLSGNPFVSDLTKTVSQGCYERIRIDSERLRRNQVGLLRWITLTNNSIALALISTRSCSIYSAMVAAGLHLTLSPRLPVEAGAVEGRPAAGERGERGELGALGASPGGESGGVWDQCAARFSRYLRKPQPLSAS